MTTPNSHTSDVQGPNLWSTTSHQYAFFYTSVASEGIVARRPHGGDWTTFQITGAARTALALGTPITDDHNFPTIFVHRHNGVDETADVVHVLANMHDNVLRYIVSAAGSITSWSSADLPDEQSRNSYPVARRVETVDFSGIWLYLRAGPENVGGVSTADNRSGNGDSRTWRLPDGTNTWESPVVLFKGYEVPGAGAGGSTGHGLAHDTEQNFNAYPAGPHVEGPNDPHPGRMHMAWLWRTGLASPVRSAIDAVTTSASPTVTSASMDFTSADLGMHLVCHQVTDPAYVGVINSESSIGLSSSATANTPMNANGSGTGVRLAVDRNRTGVFATTEDDPTVTWVVGGHNVLTALDVGAPVLSVDYFPRPSYVGEVTDGTHFELSSSPDSHVPVGALATTALAGGTMGNSIANNNILPSYAYSDDGGETWQAYDETVLTLPIHVNNNPECHTGILGDPEGFLNTGGICTDDDGEPHMVIGRNPFSHIFPDGAGGWTEELLGDADDGYTLGGVEVFGRINPYWLRGQLWFMSAGGPSNNRVPHLWRADGGPAIPMGGGTGSSGWECFGDPEAYRLFRRIETLTPDGDTIRTFSYGNKPRVRVAV